MEKVAPPAEFRLHRLRATGSDDVSLAARLDTARSSWPPGVLRQQTGDPAGSLQISVQGGRGARPDLRVEPSERAFHSRSPRPAGSFLPRPPGIVVSSMIRQGQGVTWEFFFFWVR